MNTSLFLSIRDEIALEGLEGITFEALWTRLAERDRFLREETGKSFLAGVTFDDAFKDLVFRVVVKEAKNGKVQFFKLPSARPPLVIFNRNEHFNEETGTLLYDHAKIPLDLYSPVKCVQTKEVRGSCRDFKARQDVTEQVTKFTSFRELLQADGEEGLGEDLSAIVAVASQKLRAEAMLSTSQWHTYAEMKLETYCILEYIARKRFYGYLNSVSEGMKFEDRRVKNSFYYYRNDLFRAGLLAQFPIFFFDGGRRMVTSSFVLYLTRFKPRNVNPIDWKVLELGNSLFVERQVTTLPFEVVKDHHLALGKKSGSTTSSAPPPTTATATDDQPTEEEETTTTTRKQTYVEQKSDNRRFRDFLQRYSKVFSVKRVDQEEDQVPTTPQSGRARVFYVVEYLQPLDRRLTLDDLYAGYSEKQQQQQSANVAVKEEDDEEGEEEVEEVVPTPMEVDGEEDQSQSQNQNKLPTKVARAKFHQLKRYFVERLYAVVERAGATGCTRVELLRLLNVPNFLVRNSLKGLMAAEQVTAASVQRGRQKVYIYRAKRFSTSPDIIEIPTSPSSSSTAQKGHHSQASLDSALASLGSSADHQRNRRRLELILEYVGAAGFADNLFNLRRHLKAVEQQQQRLAFSIDMRTVLRLLRSLLDGGVISIRCFRLSAGSGGGGGSSSAAENSTANARNTVLIFHNEQLRRRFPFLLQQQQQQQKEQKEVVVPAKKRGKSKEDDLLLLSLDCPECPSTVRDPASQALYLNNLLEHLLLLNKFSLFAQHQVDLRTEITVTPFPFPEMGRPGQSSVTLAAAYALKVEEDETVEIKDEDEGEEGASVLSNLKPSASISTHIVSLTAAERTNFVYEPSFTRAKYGGKRSKVERAFALYRYLFYLLVDEEKTKSTSTEEVILSTDWRYHVPKLCRLYPDLKCTVLDALLYMPLSVFRDVYQITHVVPGLEALLADRHRQHQLLSEVEPTIRRHLLYNRRALNAIFELMDWAAAFGLLKDFAEQLQFRETVTFQLVTRLTFPRPLIEGDSAPAGGGGPTVYDFACLEDWDSFVEDVEVHLLKRKSGEACSPSMCPFKEELKMHSLYAFGRKAARKTVVRVSSVTPKLTTTKTSKASKGKKRPRREVESGEEEEEEEEVAKSGKKPATRKRSKPNTFSASAQKQTIIKCEIEESDSVLKVKDKRGVATKGRAKKAATSPAAKKPAKAKETPSTKKQSPAGPGRRLLRQYWTREEDAFLLKCRLASILLDPKTPYQTCVSRTVIAEQLHLHVASSRGGKGGVTKDGDGCARRLLKFAKKAHIQQILTFSLHELQRVIGEEELATRLRPANRQDTEAMVAAFKTILGRILAHKFTSTEFFLERKGSRKDGTLLASFDDEEEEDGSGGSNGSEVVEAVTNARPALADLLASYDILDVASDERSLQKAAVFKSDPVTFYDVHHYVRTNLLLSTLTSIKFALDRIGPDSSSESTPTPESPLAPQPTTQLTITLKNFYLRSMSRALKHFPNLRLQETIVQLLDRDLIKRNRKTLKAQQILGAGYRISPAYFQRLTRFYRAFDREGLKAVGGGGESEEKEMDFFSQPFVVADRNNLFSSLQFAENLSADFVGVLDVEPKEATEEEEEEEGNEEDEEDNCREVKKAGQKRPIEFHIEVPQTFFTLAKDELNARGSNRGRQVSRSLMLSKNLAELEEEEEEEEKKKKKTKKKDILDDNEEEEEESTSSKAKKQSDPSDWNSEMMTVNHLKVCLKRQPRSRRALSAGYAQALELLRLHSRTFEPVEFESSSSSSSSSSSTAVDDNGEQRSAHLLQQCLDQFPWTVDEEEEEDGDDVMEISAAAASVLTIEQAKAAVEAIQNVRSEGLGLKWEQLVAAVFGGQAEVSQEVQAELKRFLAFCETRKLLFAVGIVSRMWVHREQIRFWLVHSHQTVEVGGGDGGDDAPTTAAAETSSTATTTTSNSGEAKQICFLPKLWKLPDGRADLETLMAAFTAILGHLSFTSPTMDRRRLLEALEWALPPVQLDELLEILLAVECIRRVPSVVGMESAQQQQQQQKKKEVTNPTTLSASFDDFFASADRDRRHLPLLSRSLSNEDDDDDVEMIDADVQKQQQKKKTTQGKQAVQQEGEGEICYEAAVDAFSRLTIFYEALREELPPTSVLTT